MTRDELIATVPLRKWDGVPYIRLVDIPEPWRNEFLLALDLAAPPRPIIDGEVDCVYDCHWQQWVHHFWIGNTGPTGLYVPEKLAKVFRNEADLLVAMLSDGRELYHQSAEGLADLLLSVGFQSDEVLILSFWESARAVTSEQKSVLINHLSAASIPLSCRTEKP